MSAASREMFTLFEDPKPLQSVKFNSKEEAIGFATSVLNTITKELMPVGALVYGVSRDHQKACLTIADASIARQALELCYPNSPQQRWNAETMT